MIIIDACEKYKTFIKYKGKKMRQKKKHYGIKLLIVLILAFCAWGYFWDAPAPTGSFEKILSNDVLQN